MKEWTMPDIVQIDMKSTEASKFNQLFNLPMASASIAGNATENGSNIIQLGEYGG